MAMWQRLLAGGTALVSSACGLFGGGEEVIRGSGAVTREAREVSGIEAVALQGTGELVITQGAAEALTIEAEDNLLPLITSEMEGGTLTLGFDRATWRESIQPTQPIRFELTVRDLNLIELSGSGSVAAGSLDSPALLIGVGGSGEVTIDQLEAEALTVTIGGSGTVTVAGQAAEQDVEITGSGEFQGGDLESQAAEVNVSGTGNVTLWVREQLDVTISGAGSVSYWGDPNVGRRDLSGSGDINPMGEK